MRNLPSVIIAIVVSFFLIQTFTTQFVFANSLQTMARTSNFLLVLSNRLSNNPKGSASTCQLTQIQISNLSQKLRLEIDAKILSLKNEDYTLITERIQTCEDDCSCDIYALALEKKGIQSKDLDAKASQINNTQREKCVTTTKVSCYTPYFKKLLKM